MHFNQRGGQSAAKRRQALMAGMDREVYICVRLQPLSTGADVGGT